MASSRKFEVTGFASGEVTYEVLAERLEAIANNTPGVVFQYLVKPDGSDRLLYVSKGCEAIWGLTQEECLRDMNNIWNMIRKGGDLEQVVADVQASIQDLSRWQSKFRIMREDGSIRYHEGFGNPVRLLDGSTRWDSIIIDITDQHTRNELIVYQNRLLKDLNKVISLILGNEDWFDVLDEIMRITGEVLNVDRVYYFETFVDSSNQMTRIGQRLEWCNTGVEPTIENELLQNIDMNDYPDFYTPLKTGNAYKAIISQLEDSPTKRALIDLDLKSVICLPIIVDGTFFGFIGFDDCVNEREWDESELNFLSTITSNLSLAVKRQSDKSALSRLNEELHQNSETMQQLNAELKRKAEALKKANLELKKQSKALKQSNDDLEQFVYIVSHDLQEPLRMITSFMALLEKKYAHYLDEKARQYIFYATDGASRMRRMLMDLLEYSRASRSNLETEPVDMNALLQEVILSHNVVIQESKAEITVDHLPTIQTSRTPLLQVVQNLLANALRYVAPGVSPKVRVHAVETPSEWQFSVSDNGIGIASENFDKIFVIFQRLNLNEPRYAGTGLGLAIAKKIIERLGGKIWVESVVGEGSTFTFTIPKHS